jgi:hypothetical protein
MSWNKNTVVQSQIRAVMKVLDDEKRPYSIEALGHVRGRGINDMGKSGYLLRKLYYGSDGHGRYEHVLMEQMLRDPDPDADDVLMSHHFRVASEPLIWPLEEWLPSEEFDERPDPCKCEDPHECPYTKPSDIALGTCDCGERFEGMTTEQVYEKLCDEPLTKQEEAELQRAGFSVPPDKDFDLGDVVLALDRLYIRMGEIVEALKKPAGHSRRPGHSHD